MINLVVSRCKSSSDKDTQKLKEFESIWIPCIYIKFHYYLKRKCPKLNDYCGQKL